MEQQQTTESIPQQTEPNSSSSSTLPPPQSSSSPNANPNLPQNPNPNPNSSTIPRPPSLQPQPYQPQQQISQNRPPFNNRTWQQQQQQQSSSAPSSVSPFSHFGASSPSVSASTSPVPPPVQRGGVAIGIPAAAQSAPFSALNSSSYGQQQQQYAGLGRNIINVPDSVASPSSPQVRQPIQGYQGTGMIGSLGTGSLVRPGSVSTLHQSRPIQPSVRPQSTPTNQAGATQNFQGHTLLRTSSVGSPASPSPNTSQNMTSHNQPWLSSGPQGKPPLPSPSFRPQMNQLGQGSHLPQNHHHSIPPASQPQKGPSSQQLQPSSQTNQNEVSGKQYAAPFRAQQNLSTQHHITRVQGAGNQKPSTLATIQPTVTQTVSQDKTANVQPSETCNRLLSKRSIHELLNQIDPSENLDPEVEDILVDIADDFVESITTFGCSLAKHRKSSTLEAKDILLHLERNWNLTLPGFSGDEIKTYKKPISNDIHKERLAAIKKSLVGNEMTNTKPSGGQAAQKGHLVKAPANTMES